MRGINTVPIQREQLALVSDLTRRNSAYRIVVDRRIIFGLVRQTIHVTLRLNTGQRIKFLECGPDFWVFHQLFAGVCACLIDVVQHGTLRGTFLACFCGHLSVPRRQPFSHYLFAKGRIVWCCLLRGVFKKFCDCTNLTGKVSLLWHTVRIKLGLQICIEFVYGVVR